MRYYENAIVSEVYQDKNDELRYKDNNELVNIIR